MLVDVDYTYHMKEWGDDRFEVEDPSDLDFIKGYIRDDLEATFGAEGIADIEITRVKEVKE